MHEKKKCIYIYILLPQKNSLFLYLFVCLLSIYLFVYLLMPQIIVEHNWLSEKKKNQSRKRLCDAVATFHSAPPQCHSGLL